MINHARTLLLNVPSSTYQPGTLGEEYIPPYSPVVLPSYLRGPHKVLFGTNPDKVFANFRVHELLSLIHQTELAEFIYALDPRVTYWPQKQTEFFTAQKQINEEKIKGIKAVKLYLTGEAQPDNKMGRAFRDYSVVMESSGGTERLLVSADSTKTTTDDVLSWTYDTVNAGGLSDPIPLFDSAIDMRVSDTSGGDGSGYIRRRNMAILLLESSYNILFENQANIFLETSVESSSSMPMRMPTLPIITTGQTIATWRVQVYSRPGDALKVCMPALEFLGEPFYLELFGVAPKEPFETFRNIWFTHPVNAYRLAAFTLAMIYRTNERREVMNG
jgi:hypothetical protein